MTQSLHVGLIGQKFMGRAHSNAWSQVGRFFEVQRTPVLHKICARNGEELAPFAQRWGWAGHTTDWRELAADPEVDLVDIGTPNHVHAEQAVAMLEAGKHVACEKPLAGTLDDARAMARTIAGHSPEAIRAGKQLWNRAPQLEPAAALALETELQIPLIGSKNQLEAVQARFMKRPPVFEDPT